MKTIHSLKTYKAIHSRQEEPFLLVFYLLEGSCLLQENDSSFPMEASDFCVVNPSQPLNLDMDHGLLVRLALDPAFLMMDDDENPRFIDCSTKNGLSFDLRHMQSLLDELLLITGDGSLEQLKREKQVCDLMLFMLRSFSHNSRWYSSMQGRKSQILSYLALHAKSDLSLEEIASHFSLTPPYFSKYFKETFGQSFLKYLAEFRIKTSLPLLQENHWSVLDIALESGFPNLNAYNSAFKRLYGMTPGAWRKENTIRIQEQLADQREIARSLSGRKEKNIQNQLSVQVSLKEQLHPLQPFWFEILNIGSVSQMQRGRNQNFLKEIIAELPFRHIRFFLDAESFGQDGFDLEESMLDFMIDHQLKPWIVLDYRFLRNRFDFFETFYRFLEYYFNRYGLDILKQWTFELYFNSDFEEAGAREYDEFCHKLNDILKSFGYSGEVTGPGLEIMQNCRNLENFCKYNTQIKKAAIGLSPLLFCTHTEAAEAAFEIQKTQSGDSTEQITDSETYREISKESPGFTNKGNKESAKETCKKEKVYKEIYMERRTSPDYFMQDLKQIRHILSEYGIQEVVPVSWKDSLYDRDVLNDSNYRAARLVQAFFMASSISAALPIAAPFDLSGSGRGIFAGDPGLLSPKDIRKPAFYACKFFQHLDASVNYSDDHILVTSDGSKYIQILMNNCTQLSHSYFLEENNQERKNLQEYFQEARPLQIHLELDHCANTEYIVKVKQITENQGNAYSRYLNMAFGDNSFIGTKEIEYLKASSIPCASGFRLQSQNGKLIFDCILEPNEVRHLHLIAVKGTGNKRSVFLNQ